MYRSVVTLQQHFRHTSRETEVTVNLEWRMGIEEVGISPAVGIILSHGIAWQQTEHVAYYFEGVVAIEHTCPEIYLPTDAPSRSHVATLDECVAGSLEEKGRLGGRNLVARIEPVEMRYMTVSILWVIGIHKPLLHLVMTAYLHGRQKGEGVHQRILVLRVSAQCLCGEQCGVEGIECYLVVHGATCRDACSRAAIAVFGRHRRSRYEPSVFRMFGQVAHKEISRTFEYGVVLAQKILVACEEVMLPQMLCRPGSAVGPHTIVCAIHGS